MITEPEFASVRQLVQAMRDKGVTRLYLKRMSPNDNSKNQPYLGPDISSIGFLPVGKWKGFRTSSEKQSKTSTRFIANISLVWMDGAANLYPAPNSKVIFYPRYPEVRLSGFLQGSNWTSNGLFDPARRGREKGRMLFLGVTQDSKIICHACDRESTLASEIEDHNFPRSGVIEEIPLASTDLDIDAKDELLRRLLAIHRKGWIDSARLDPNGKPLKCNNRNCGGYTLESEFGITPNGFSKPDFLGWEIKQYGVKDFTRDQARKISILTPEPTGGFYGQHGVKAFVLKYGRLNKKNPDRMDFVGVHKCNQRRSDTGLMLTLEGYDPYANKGRGAINDPEGGALSLSDERGDVAASWSFEGLVSHWTQKHQNCVYVRSESRARPRQYRYGSEVRLGHGTSFELFLKSIWEQKIILDPAPKVEELSGKQLVKARNQFRVSSKDIGYLYHEVESVQLGEQSY